MKTQNTLKINSNLIAALAAAGFICMMILRDYFG
jgi:hypothetical protein